MACPKARLTMLLESDGACTECTCETRGAFLKFGLVMQDDWWSEDYRKVGNDVLCFSSAPSPCLLGGGICPPDTWAAGVAPSLDSLALVGVRGFHARE